VYLLTEACGGGGVGLAGVGDDLFIIENVVTGTSADGPMALHIN
jgi:hypothetical protein